MAGPEGNPTIQRDEQEPVDVIPMLVACGHAEHPPLPDQSHHMKPVITSLLTAITLSATAQPVLQYGNLDLIGKTFPVHVMTDAGTADPTTDGANITWNFSSITLQMNAGTASFVDPASTPFASSYPTSNLAQVVSTPLGTSYTYFLLTASSLDMLAEDVGGTSPETYTDPKTPLQFPLAYQDSFVDNYTSDGSSSTVTRVYSAYGTVILPTGTYTDVVKVTSSSGNIDFYHSNPLEPLGHVDSDGMVIVYGDAMMGVADLGHVPVLSAMPNPATDNVLVTGLARNAQWQLVDLQGRVLMNGTANAAPLQLNLGTLAEGPYALVVLDDNARRSIRVVKQ
jgi:hypothetical protein